uniref:BPL/LPL catalytic domain-containing protein n=1 Tax=Elaeophora elaphi TaxID=1147741 RepID=A0A158Q7P7_9BILA
MIFFVWSLVLSAVQFARRQRLLSALSEYFIWNLSHNSVLLCRKIPCFSCFSRNRKGYERLSGTLDSLRKASSEPCLPGELITRPIYRTEEMEFVVQTDTIPLDIVDWNIFTPPIHGSIPRVHFIAFLDEKSDEYNEILDGISLTGSLDVTGDHSNTNNDTVCSSDLSPVLVSLPVSNLCNKIAHRRGRPWEILYECTLYDFYDIAFAWSQNALFDIGGKVVVKMMKVITLPEKFFFQLDDSSSLQRSVSPFSSLHYNHRLEFPVSSTFQLSVDVPNNDCFEYMKPTSSRSRTCSVSLERTRTVLSEAAPLYVRYLKEQDKMSKWLSRLLFKLDLAETLIFIYCETIQKFQCATGYYISSLHDGDVNIPVKLVEDSIDGIEKQVVTYQIPNEMSHASIEHNLTLDEVDQIHLQLNENRVTSKPIIDFSNQVQMEPSQISIISDQKSVVRKFQNQSTPNSGPTGNTQQNRFSKRIVNSTTFEKKESQSSNLIAQDASKMLPATVFRPCLTPKVGALVYHYDIPELIFSLFSDYYNTPPILTPSPLLFRSPEEQRKLLGKEMFRIFSGSHLHTTKDGGKVVAKPLMILVFTGNNDDLFNRILETLSTIIPSDTHTIFHLSYEAFCKHPWIGQSTACLIVADTSHLDDNCWLRLQQYFSNNLNIPYYSRRTTFYFSSLIFFEKKDGIADFCFQSGKILFLCQNKLLASLSACDNSKKTAKLLKMAFGERQSKKLGKDFEHFLKKTLKTLHKEKKVNQTFHAKDFFGGCKYSVVLNKTEDSPFLLYMENAAQHASALFSDATSEQLLQSGSMLIADALSRLSIKIATNLTLPPLTAGYFICEYDRMPWDMEGMHFNEPFGSMPKILLKQISKHGPLPEVSSELLPVEVRTRAEHLPDFDDEIYFRRLETLRFGKALLYIPVCETTMDIGKSLAFAMPEEPIVIVARQQIKGKGRSGNQWLSPVGCAMFTFNYMLSPGSSLNNNIGIIQHIFCVAIVSGICSLRKELENFPLKIKWPNDLYYGRTCKMGGLIVNATTINDKTICTIGVGLNLSNSKPTACINDFLPPDLRIRQEDYIANTLNKFQYYVDLYENEGENAFLKHYYRFWLHSREEVTLSDTNEKVVIKGLDHYGFLKVRNRQNGKVMVVHPDGNTFDMMKGLITAKYI